jgi:Mn2+/Fe2+ NRAMP family transporter
MSREKLNQLLLVLVILLLVGAVATLVPFTNPMVSDMGYHTLCPFAPWSTLTLLFLAGVGWTVRRYVAALPA